MSPLEKETKLVVSPDDYRRLRELGTLLDQRDQLNIYFHDPTRLREGVGYFRVRFETGRDPVATLKIPVGWRGEMREMVEVERPLSELGPTLFPRPRRWVTVDTGVPEGFMEHFQALGITRLRRLGWMGAAPVSGGRSGRNDPGSSWCGRIHRPRQRGCPQASRVA